MNETDINTVVCPEEYDFVRPHKKGNTFVTGYCRQSPREKKKQLAREGISAIPFGWDAIVAYDYARYGRKELKEKKDE